MSGGRAKLLILQALVAVVAIGVWHVGSSVPIGGVYLLPKFFFSTPADVAAIGDNLNDVEMLDFAGTAYVMGNAGAALKARGYRHTASNDDGGLAVAIRECLERTA